jgi:hypothetical protein
MAGSLLLRAQPTATPPGQVSYQGFVTDANGIPLATNNPINFNIQFRIWNASTGGSNMWGELQVVTVDRGYFTVMLGNGSSLPGVPFTNNLSGLFSGSDASDRYLELTVQGLAPGDPAIIPRLRLLGSPYSYLASRALNVPDTGLSPNVALRSAANVFTGNQTITAGSLYMDNSQVMYAKNTGGTYEPFLWPRWNDNVMYMNYGAGGFNIRNNLSTPVMFMTTNGNVGIGATPGFPLNFANSLGDKISLYGNTGNHFGFGIQGSLLQIYADIPASDIAFGYGQSSSLTELMRIKGTGSVGIGTASPGSKLHVSDSGFPSARIDSSSTAGTWLALGNSSTGGRYWQLISTGSGNGGGAGKMLVTSGTSAGFTDVTPMTFQSDGKVGISTLSPGRLLQIGTGVNQADAMIRLNCGNGTAGRSWDIGVPYGGGNVNGTNYSFVIEDSTVNVTRLMVDWNTGDVCIGTTTPIGLLTVGSAYCNGTSWQNGSDRGTKEGFAEIDPLNVLDKVSSLPITEWSYKTDSGGIRHLGPVAQDFHKAFGLNGADDKHISTVDESGVALAAIQGLNQKLEQRESEITELKARLEKLERLLSHTSDNTAR